MPKKLTTNSNNRIIDSDNDSDSSNSSKNTKNTNISKKDDTVTTSIKKRGRPRKNALQLKSLPSIKHVNVEKIQQIPQDEEIILHLPLYEEVNDSSSEKNMFTMKDDSVFDIFDTHKENKGFKSLSSTQNNDDDDSDYSMNFNTNSKIKSLLMEIQKKDAYISKLKANLTELKNDTFCDNAVGITKETRFKMLNLKLINIKDNKHIVVDKTNIVCWWCTYNFDTIPCFIPDKYVNDTYYVFGCFCTYSCALSYNIEMRDYKVGIRNSLIKKLYSKIFSTDEQIHMAPPKELLERFCEKGGLTIEQFRNNSMLCKKEYKLSLPPLIPLMPMMEEAQRESQTSIVSGKVIKNK
jgi:hypothetical protein